MWAQTARIRSILDDYLARFPRERRALTTFFEQLHAGENLDDRHNFTGHITASALILSPDRKEILLIHHKQFDRWQQPGGHWEADADPSPYDVAVREATEETAFKPQAYLPLDPDTPLLPLNIDSHLIADNPERHEPAHYHHDFRYVFVAADRQFAHGADEPNIQDIRWFLLDDPGASVVAKDIAKLRQAGMTVA